MDAETLGQIYDTAVIPINIAITIVVAIVLRTLLLAISRRTIRKMVSDAHNKNLKHQLDGVPVEISELRQVQRTQTMGTVFSNLISWVIIIVAAIIVLQQLGVSVTAIVATAGIGAAMLGFGAQNIVKDVLNGMFIVVEDQYGVGDRVDLGLAQGVVESVGVRITTLKDDDGTIWFVRNGEITRVGNKTYGVAAKPKTGLLSTTPKRTARNKATASENQK